MTSAIPSTRHSQTRTRPEPHSTTANLLPLCAHHHGKVHDAGWQLALGPNRELTVTFPDGTVHNTGPPARRAA